MTALDETVEHPLTPEDVAALLQVDRETIYRMARRGELPAFKVSTPLALPAVAASALDGGRATAQPERRRPVTVTVVGSIAASRRTPMPPHSASAPPPPPQARGHRHRARRLARKGPMWLMKYRLPDGTESMRILGPAWVQPRRPDPRGWRPRRGRPPEGTLSEDAAPAALRGFLDEQTERTPPERVSFERCADAFLERCEEKQRSPNTMRTYRQIVAEVTARWEGWRIVDVDADELEDYRDELAERGLAA